MSDATGSRAGRSRHDRRSTGERSTPRRAIAAPGRARQRHPDPALLLPPEALDRRQLPDVPGQDRGRAEARDRLQHAGRATAWSSTPRRRGRRSAPRRDGAAARQPSARLSDLRPGRASATCRTTRSGTAAATRARTSRAARLKRNDIGAAHDPRPGALHPLPPLRALLPRDHARPTSCASSTWATAPCSTPFAGRAARQRLLDLHRRHLSGRRAARSDFHHKRRVWFLEETESVCPSCSNGCNVKLGIYRNEIRRMLPRRNDAVNDTWMCDHGRLNYHFVTTRRACARRASRRRRGVERQRRRGTIASSGRGARRRRRERIRAAVDGARRRRGGGDRLAAPDQRGESSASPSSCATRRHAARRRRGAARAPPTTS